MLSRTITVPALLVLRVSIFFLLVGWHRVLFTGASRYRGACSGRGNAGSAIAHAAHQLCTNPNCDRDVQSHQ
ncbi:hypothetical protein FN846DRAFT_981409 [Sphaerosporella brunnea]|uniref:Uncharacterized protein n=1 Tax=Sphaerosporella brunnea TaxID=1250544 RepID=A0A5J5EC93_9PEZI|nr:hypothetical protein FN846DRAFT_981409 [Sphaerosporella brunnea]